MLSYKKKKIAKCASSVLYSNHLTLVFSFCREAVSFHRKLLGRFRNPYTHLNSYKDHRPVASVTPPSSSVVPSHRSKTSRSSASHPPRKSPPALHVSSAPPPSVAFPNIPTLRRSSSNSIAPIVVGCTGGVLLLLLATGVFFFKSKAGKSVNPWRTGLSGQLQKVFITGNLISTILINIFFNSFEH